MRASSVIIFLSAWGCLCSTAFGDSIGETVGDLPPEIASNILTILINGTVQLLGNCSTAYDVSQVQFWLYTRQNDPVNLNSLTPIDPNKPTIILIHGWMSGRDADSIAAIRNAYLQRYDCNLITVDHSVYTSGDYQTAYCHIGSIGLRVAQFICNMSSTLNTNLLDLHVVGHSLGAHISGAAGAATNATCGKLGRITGLDPAGPLFQGINKNQRLDDSDAKFVDVIHSNAGEFGYVGNLGHVDFYPNCGSIQPGCFSSIVTNLGDIVNELVTAVGCSHSRSCYLFAESINRNAFSSTDCLLCGLPVCLPNILFGSRTYMGESCRSKPADDDYTLTTNAQPPYGRGPQGPLN